MKRIIAAAAAFLLIPAAACAEGSVYLNNSKTGELRTEGGRTLIAVRDFFESAGYTVQWSVSEHRAVAFDEAHTIVLTPDSPVIFVDRESCMLDGTVEVCEGRLYMPVSAAVCAIDAAVEQRGGDLYLASELAVDDSAWQYEVLELVNAERRKYGLEPLIWNAALAQGAQRHCEDMAARGYFSHDTPEGITQPERLESLGISFRLAAENIAAGQPGARSVTEAWLKSPKHRKNILDPNLRETGIAFVRGGRYGIYWAQEFIAGP